MCAGGYLHAARLLSCDLMRCLQHLHEESVYRCVSDKFEEEQVLQALQSYGAQSGQTEEQLGKPEKRKKKTLRLHNYPHDLHTVSIYTYKEPKSVLKYRGTAVLLHQ